LELEYAKVINIPNRNLIEGACLQVNISLKIFFKLVLSLPSQICDENLFELGISRVLDKKN